MAGFNTHGGYFAPAGYMRINAGGSHEENPNGGVQVGVDPQGIPNMVEEGESIYQDFVFSDNIKAQEKFLVEVNLPKRYAGKLYSEIVDDLFAEAEERPNDPVSKNGLDAMLGRLAQAQEEQKAAEEEAALLEELKNMSPEEVAALEQQLAEQMAAEQQPQMEPEVPVEAGQEMMPQEAMMPEEQIQPDMMPIGYACGGRMNKYEPGGPLSARELQQKIAAEQALIDRVQRSYRYNEAPFLYDENGNPRGVIGGNGVLGLLSGAGLVKAGKALHAAGAPARTAKAVGKWGSGVKKVATETAEAASKAASEARSATKAAKQAMSESGKKIIDAAKRGEEVSAEAIEKYNAERQAFQEARAKSLNAGAKKVGTDIAVAGSKLLPGKGNPKMTVDAATEIAEQASVAAPAAEAQTTVRGGRRFWPTFLKTSAGLGLLGGGYAAYNKFIADSDEVKGFDAKQNSGGDELVSFDDFINGFKRGGIMNKFENGTRYGRTPDGQLVQIVERTDGNGTTWQKYVPVQESGSIDSAAIVSLPQVNVTYNRPVASAPHAFMIPYGAGFGGGARGGLSGNVYAVNSGTANGTAIGGGARGNMYDLGEPSEAIVYPPTTGTVSVGGMMPQAEVVGYRGLSNEPIPDAATNEAVVYGYRRPQTGSSAIKSVGPTTMSDEELDAIIKGRELGWQLPSLPNVVNGRAVTNSVPFGYNDWAGNRFASTVEPEDEPVLADPKRGRPSVLSTLPRYAGAIGSGLLALNTLLQQPDHYDDTPIRPALPTGRILLQDQRYMPLDQNAVTNQMQAQNTANARAIMNSGAGPSTGALIAAADYTGGLNLGNALGNVWQANNQERNRVISANNQNAATRAQFYRDLNSQRAQILNNMAMYNRQNALRVAMLNNQAEQDKYNAFGQNLGNALQALSGIGQENFAMNQLNTNTALGWYVGPDGRAYYRGPNWSNCGGLLKKIKK